MPIIQCYLNDEEFANLKKISQEKQETPEFLAEAAISDAICEYFRDRSNRNDR